MVFKGLGFASVILAAVVATGSSPANHYAFELFALDDKVDLPANAARNDVLKAMDGHIIGHATIVAPFDR